jgi:hypothetical protein
MSYLGAMFAMLDSLLVLGAKSAEAQAPAKAPAQVCASKLGAIASGESPNVEDDLQWLSSYCDTEVYDQAVNLVASATADAALGDMQAAHGNAAEQAKSDIAAGNATVSAANVDAMANALATTPSVAVTTVHVTEVRPAGVRSSPPFLPKF